MAGLTFREPKLNREKDDMRDDEAGGYGVIGDGGTLVEVLDCEFCL